MDQIYELLSQSDLFISIGTSGSVYPAADFVNIVKKTSHAHSINVNLEKSLHYNAFDENRYGKATELVPELIKEILDKNHVSTS
jgi:NAD-dependent deacetylase